MSLSTPDDFTESTSTDIITVGLDNGDQFLTEVRSEGGREKVAGLSVVPASVYSLAHILPANFFVLFK